MRKPFCAYAKIVFFCCHATTALHKKVMTAIAKSAPPSSFTFIPKNSKCDRIATLIVPIASIAPYTLKRGISNKMAATNSTMPEIMRPNGSAPSVLKI